MTHQKQEKTDAEVLIEGLKDLLGPANNLLEGLVEQAGSTPAMSASFQQYSISALFTGRFEEWKSSFDEYRKAYNKNLADSKKLLKALNTLLEKGADIPQEYRDSLVAFRTTLESLADNEPIKEYWEDEECCGAREGCQTGGGCACKK